MLAIFSLFGQTRLRKRKLHVCKIRSTISGSGMLFLRKKARDSPAWPVFLLATANLGKKLESCLAGIASAGCLLGIYFRLGQAIHSTTDCPRRQQRAIDHPPVAPALFAVRPGGDNDFSFTIVLSAEYFLRICLCGFRMRIDQVSFEHGPSPDQERGQQYSSPDICIRQGFPPVKTVS